MGGVVKKNKNTNSTVEIKGACGATIKCTQPVRDQGCSMYLNHVYVHVRVHVLVCVCVCVCMCVCVCVCPIVHLYHNTVLVIIRCISATNVFIHVGKLFTM